MIGNRDNFQHISYYLQVYVENFGYKFLDTRMINYLLDETNKPPLASNNNLNSVVYFSDNARMRVKFDCLKQNKRTFNGNAIVNIYIMCVTKKFLVI